MSRTRPSVIRWAAAALAAAGGLGAASAVLPAAHAGPAMNHRVTGHAAANQPAAHHGAIVVKVVTRHHFGKILATTHGRALYIKPHGGCSGGCLSIWPRLLLPKGQTVPKGTRCLGTAAAGHRRQVTYRGKRLYLFSGDSGTSVNGNNQGGFKVAKFSSRAC